jgi:ferredoxin-NADP reductase
MGVVVGIRDETRRAKTFRVRLGHEVVFRAGQHYIVRLTAPDGYTAARSYSVASAPDGSAELELTVEWLDDGEVSTFLHDVLQVGDELEVRGPIGGWFVWDGTTPALLVGGGSGLVPLMSMLRLARQQGTSDLVRLIASVRSPDDLYYARELRGPETTVVYTRRTPPNVDRPPGHLAAADLPTDFIRRTPPDVERAARHVGGGDLAADVVRGTSPDVERAAGQLGGGEPAGEVVRRAPADVGPAGELGGGELAGEGGGDGGVVAYVCGSSGFVNHASELLMGAGIPAGRIRVERFGPTS